MKFKKTTLFFIPIFSLILLYALYMGYEYIQYKKWQERNLLQDQPENLNKELTQEEKLKKVLDSLDPTKELENIKIDEYNFQQLEKVKFILDDLVGKGKKIPNTGIEKFNIKFNQKIEPKKNCYYIGTYNGREKYIFGFKLESKKYIMQYKTEYYAYPKYDIPSDYICTGECYDYIFDDFMYTISNSCEK